MSQTDTPNVADKYSGVTDQTDGLEPVEAGLRPSGMSKLKEHFETLPHQKEAGVLKKVGLTESGHVAYRNQDTGALVYYTISIRNDGPTTGRHRSHHGAPPSPSEPHSGFGGGWIVKSHHSQLPEGDGFR